MLDEKTINRNYPLPHPDNMLEEDVARIKDSFEQIDLDVNDLLGTTTQLIEDVQSGSYWYGISTGTSSSYEVILNPVPTVLNAGIFIRIKAHVQNTGIATINVNSLGVKNIKRIDGSDLKQGDIPQDALVTLIYDGINFQLTNAIADPETEEINASNIMRAFDEIQENHGGALLMEAGWSDSFGNPNEQGADEVNSTGQIHDAVNTFYKGTDPGVGLNSDKNYDMESEYLQQEWTNSNQVTSQASATNSSTSVTLSSGIWPTNCAKGRISFDGGSTFYIIGSRNSDTQITLESNYTGSTSSTLDYKIRLTEFDSGEVGLCMAVGSETIDQSQYLSIHDDQAMGNSSANHYRGQTFQSGVSAELSKVRLQLKRFGNPIGNVIVELRTTDGSAPTATVLASAALDASEVLSPGQSSVGGWKDFTFDPRPTLVSGTKYAIVAHGSYPDDASNYVTWRYEGSGFEKYADGKAYYSSNGSSWTNTYQWGDHTFETQYVNPTGVASEYVSVCDIESQKVDTSSWANINNSSITETLNSQNVYYWLAFDPVENFGDGTEIKIFNLTGAVWRKIAQNNAGTWEYNNDATNTATEDWVASTIDDMLHAVSQAISTQTANRMTGASLMAITNTQWGETNGWSTSVNSILRGVTFYSNDTSQTPNASQYRLKYDSERGAMDLRSKTYDPGFVPSESYIWSRIEHSDSDGPGSFYITRNGGTEWTLISLTQQGLPLAGDIRVYRGIVDVSGQTSGQDLRCRYQTEQNKDQFIHSWGLQLKS